MNFKCFIMEKICPRCFSSFICRNDNIMECWCLEEKIPVAVREYLSLNFVGCLCKSCIKIINNNHSQILQPVNLNQNENL